MTYAEPDGGTHPETTAELDLVRRGSGSKAPAVVVFDVNETLSDTGALGAVFEEVGLPVAAAPLWFARVLRDGFAIGLTGGNVAFADVARSVLPRELTDRTAGERAAAEQRILGSFAELPLHADVAAGLRSLVAAGIRIVTLTNGSPAVAERLLGAAGLDGLVDRYLSVADGPIWKPGAAAYTWAADRCGVDVGELMLVAVHPWGVHCAASAGARTAWVNRSGDPYPAVFTPAEVTVRSLGDLVAALRG
ncbi:MAG: haloacid dehalogenase type II [Propionibacteriaceae bacterium]